MKLSKTIIYTVSAIMLTVFTAVFLFSQVIEKSATNKNGAKVSATSVPGSQLKNLEAEKNFAGSQDASRKTLPPDELEELKREVKLGKFRGVKFPKDINLREKSLEELEALRKEIVSKKQGEVGQ